MRSVARRVLPVLPAVIGTQRRNFEYWGLHVGPRTQPYCAGEKVSSTFNPAGVTAVDQDALYLTGNGALMSYNSDTLHDIGSELDKMRHHESFYTNQSKYILAPVEPEICESVSKLFDLLGSHGKSAMFRALFKDYPNLAKPLDAATQEALINFYAELIPIAHDEAAVTLKATPFVMEVYEQKFISWTYWWRISEKLMEQIEQLQEARSFETRCTRLVIERLTKIIYNTFANQPWAHEEITSPYHFDICTHRAYHDIGLW